jgi:hypothetical protein
LRSKDDWLYLITDVVKFFSGGVNYNQAKKMPLTEILALRRHASRINKEIKAQMSN